MSAKEHLFDISHRDKRRESVCSIADILHEIFLIEEGFLHEILFELDNIGQDESFEVFQTRHIVDELMDIIWTLANLYG